MNINRFDLELPCDLEPFGYIEDRRIVKTKNAGKLMLVAFGALNYMGHYAPEFGGVAMVHMNPDLLIAVKYIPWNAEARRDELMTQYKFLKENHHDMSPSDVTCYFYDDGYVLPAQKKRLKEEYFQEIAEANKVRAQAMMAAMKKEQEMQEAATSGSRVAKLNPRMVKEKDEPEEKQLNHKVYQKKDSKTVDGEELIPLDDDDEEEEL